MSRTVAFLAETRGSPTIDEQKACLDPDDHVVVAGQKSFSRVGKLLESRSLRLNPGDRIKVFDLSCISLSTTTLIRVLTRKLRAGITLELVSAGIILEPGAEDKLHAMLVALDGHHRHVRGLKTNPADAAPRGRKRLLDADQLPAIREKLNEPGATATKVAQEFGVARSTLFNYLERHDRERRADQEKKTEKRRSQDVTDHGNSAEHDADDAPALDMLVQSGSSSIRESTKRSGSNGTLPGSA